MKKGTSYQGKEERQLGSAVLQERGMKKKSATSMLRSANRDWGASKLAEERRKGGVWSAEWNNGAPIQAEEHRWGLRSALSAEERRKRGGWVRSAEYNIGAPAGIEEHPSQAEERGHGGIERGLK